MTLKLTLLLAALLAAPLLPARAEGFPKVDKNTQFVYYEGVVASVNHATGELVILGQKDESPDDVIVKLQVDPKEVYVTNAQNQILEFSNVAKEDQVGVDCYLADKTLVVDTIFLYKYKPEAE